MPGAAPDILMGITNTKKVNVFDDWSIYVPTPGKVAGEMGTGDCGDATFTTTLKAISTQPATMLNLPGDFTIYSTTNPSHWTLKQFTEYRTNPKTICAAAGTYPLHAYPDMLLWTNSCGSGAVMNLVDEAKARLCETTQKSVEAYFSPKYSDSTVSLQYPKNFKINVATTNLPANNQKCIYISKIVEPNPTEPEQVGVCLYTKEKAQPVEAFIQSQYEKSVTLLNAMTSAKDYSGYEKITITKGANTFTQFANKQTSEKTAMRDFGTMLVSVSVQGTSDDIVGVYDQVLITLQKK